MSSDKQVLYFTAKWCGPCQSIKPTFYELQQQFDNISFSAIDVDENPDMADQYQVKGIPFFVFINDAKIIDKFAGAKKDKLIESVNKLNNL